MNPQFLGFLRGVGVAIVIAILSYIGDASHISFIGNPVVETVIASAVLALEHALANKTGKALFGAVNKS